MRMPKYDNNNGFTFFEVVVVLVMISIFSVWAAAQHTATDPTLVVQAQILQSHIRYTQMRAMNSDAVWGIHYNQSATAANRYYEIFVEIPSNTVTLPGEPEKRVILGEMGITLNTSDDASSPSPQSFWLTFDSWGEPYFGDGALGQPATVPLAANPVLLNLSKPGLDDEPLVVTQHTGFIP